MDNTLIDNDCDVSWKEFLIATGRVDAEQQELVDRFYQEYKDGILRFDEFLEFQLTEFVGQPSEAVQRLARAHFEDVVRSRIYPQASAMIRKQLEAGDAVCILTATNTEVARPLADVLGIDTIVGTELEVVDGVFTGKIRGTYCCGAGKLERLAAYCSENGIDMAEVHYYGDSTSDLDVLNAVGHPHAVNPMPKLREIAVTRGWDILDFELDA